MENPDTISRVKSGLRLVGLILAFVIVAGMFFAGASYTVFASGGSRPVGLMLLAISVSIMACTMNRWLKILPGILGVAVLNGVITLSTGHLLNNSGIPTSRTGALFLTLFFAASCLLSRTFLHGDLDVIDRVVALAFVACLPVLIGFGSIREQTVGRSSALSRAEFVTMAIGICFLLVAWTHDRVRRVRRYNGSRSEDGDSNSQSPEPLL